MVTLSGCGQSRWHHPNNNESMFYSDSMNCESYARQAVQQSKQSTSRPNRDPAYNTKCQANQYSNSVECRTERDTTNDNYDRSYQQGENLGNAIFGGMAFRNHYSNCMKSKGYQN